MEIRTVLVPIDFSDPSAAALDAAISLAKRFEARVHLLHVYQINTAVYPYGMIIGPEVEQKLHEAARKSLEEWCDRAVREGVSAEATVAPGTPSETILRQAEELPADMIVMGTRGLSGLKHVLLGSVAERVVQKARCPVLTLHGEAVEAD